MRRADRELLLSVQFTRKAVYLTGTFHMIWNELCVPDIVRTPLHRGGFGRPTVFLRLKTHDLDVTGGSVCDPSCPRPACFHEDVGSTSTGAARVWQKMKPLS